jgi:DNA-binding helix-hairpin-helix protein with protein kinase domain
MNTQIKIIIAAAAALILGFAIVSMISNAKVRSMERAVNAAKQQARASEESAAAAEMQAAGYKQKTEYLETQIAEIGSIARRQDEELEKVSGDVGNARRDVERARKPRAIDANSDELCRKLAELGYPCR